jgi:hypothetical protein
MSGIARMIVEYWRKQGVALELNGDPTRGTARYPRPRRIAPPATGDRMLWRGQAGATVESFRYG